MPHIRNNGLPAYQRIQSTIVKRLETGLLKAGDLVDSERELASIHGVSLMTARHALTGLEREGLVVRRRGAGTFVAPPKIHFNKLMSYTEEMSRRGLAVSSKLLSLGVIETEPEIAARLSLPVTSRLIKVERLRLGEDEPFAIETCYLSADEFGRSDASQAGPGVVVFRAGARLRTSDRPCGRRNRRHRRRRTHRSASRYSCWLASTAHPARDFFHEGKTRALRARPLPIRPPQAVYP